MTSRQMKPQKKIILLDDEPIVCERLKPALEKIGFYVEAYTESQEAIDRLSKDRFDVLVTDRDGKVIGHAGP